jgi:hypothetical protein
VGLTKHVQLVSQGATQWKGGRTLSGLQPRGTFKAALTTDHNQHTCRLVKAVRFCVMT